MSMNKNPHLILLSAVLNRYRGKSSKHSDTLRWIVASDLHCRMRTHGYARMCMREHAHADFLPYVRSGPIPEGDKSRGTTSRGDKSGRGQKQKGTTSRGDL